MAIPTNPDTYRVFLGVLAEAPRATTYKCMKIRNGESVKSAIVLPGTKFDQLPWNGEVGDIVSASWEIPRGYALLRGLDPNTRIAKEVTVSMDIPSEGGILVCNPFDRPYTNAVGLIGVMPGNPMGMNFRNPCALNRITVGSDREMVTQVLDLITTGGWQKADETIALQREFSR